MGNGDQVHQKALAAEQTQGSRSELVGHTPGPWFVFIGTGEFIVMPAGRPGEIATIPSALDRSSEAAKRASADADLIAAAPDLAFAAMEAWKAISWVINYDSEDGYLAAAREHLEAALKKSAVFDFVAMRAGLENIRAALSKAEPTT